MTQVVKLSNQLFKGYLMAKISIYYNERASNADDSIWVNGLKSELFRHELSVLSPKDLNELDQCIKNDLESETDFIFSVGGDGTANTIIQKIVGSQIKFMCIPAGTANDFAHELGIKKNLEQVIKIFQKRSTKKVDVLKINERYMLGNGGIGIAAEVANTINQYRKELRGFKKLMKKMGANIYPALFAKEMLLKPFKRYKLHLDSPDLPFLNPIIETSLILINNQPTLGGKFLVAPNSNHSDGKFNVTIFLHKNRSSLISCALRILKGDFPYNDKDLIQFETTRIGIANLSGETVDFFGDGELLEQSNNFEISIQAQAIEVCSFEDRILSCEQHSLREIRI
jgi:diacylglycerol kinase family enzyme